jgi:hypothetical protein
MQWFHGFVISELVGCWFGLKSQTEKTFSIRDGILKVALEDLRDLKLHERVIDELVEKLKDSILNAKVIKDPVVVDEKTLVVLDGMHRVATLKELGYSYIPCCLIDYRLPVVQLGAWYRVVSGDGTINEIVELIRSSFQDLKLAELSVGSPDRLVNEKGGVCALRSYNSMWLISTEKKLDCGDIYDVVYSLEERIRSENLKISYQTEFDAKTIILSDKSATCLVVPTLSKDDVLRYALSGKVFAPKATRHVFPFRLLGVNAPIDILDGKRLTLNEANERFLSSFSSRKLVKLPGGQIVDGRRYEEPIYFFENYNENLE